MNIVFFGNGSFGMPSLKKLYNSNYKLLCLISNTPKSKSRKKNQKLPILQKTANDLNIEIINQDVLTDINFINNLKSLNPDLFIVVSYKIIPGILLDIPKYGSINLHASMLPKYRGSSPIQRALINGETEIGLTTFLLNSGIDKGDIIAQKKYKLNDRNTYTELHDKLAVKGSQIIIDSIESVTSKDFVPKKQSNTKISYAKKINKNEYRITFDANAFNLHNKIRGLTFPGCYCYYLNKRVKLFNTYYDNNISIDLLKNIGDFTFENNCIYIKCKKGFLIVNEVQFEGKKIIKAIDFKNMNLKKDFFN